MSKKRKKRVRRKKTQIDNTVLNSDSNVIDLDAERAARRKANREKAAARRRRKGRKSLSAQVMEEVDLVERPEASSDGKSSSKKKKQRKPVTSYFVVILIAALILGIMLMSSLNNIMELRNEETAKKQEVVDLESQKANLERKVEGLGSEEFVMQQARNWLKMAKSGEYVYIFREN